MNIQVTPGLELRSLMISDAHDIFYTIDSQRAYLGQWLPFVAYTKNLSDSEKFIESVVNAPKERFEHIFTIRKQNGFVGLIGFRDTDTINKKTEIGYWLSQPYQKQGIVTQSVRRLVEFAFDNMEINRIQIRCAVGNMASQKIPVALGFKFEGVERAGELLTGNVFTDLMVYSKLKSDG